MAAKALDIVLDQEEIINELLGIELTLDTLKQRCYILRKKLGADPPSSRKGPALSAEAKTKLLIGLNKSLLTKKAL